MYRNPLNDCYYNSPKEIYPKHTVFILKFGLISVNFQLTKPQSFCIIDKAF